MGVMLKFRQITSQVPVCVTLLPIWFIWQVNKLVLTRELSILDQDWIIDVCVMYTAGKNKSFWRQRR